MRGAAPIRWLLLTLFAGCWPGEMHHCGGRPGNGGDRDRPEREVNADPIHCVGLAENAPPECAHALHLVERARVEQGGPLRWREFVVLDLDGDPERAVEAAVVRGGRVEVRRAGGALLWQSPVIGARRLEAVVDLDGDGPREVVVSTRRGVRVFAGLTGEPRWSLPEQPLGPDGPRFEGLHRVMVADVDADGLPDLYAADGGCGGAGSANGVFYSFAGGFDAPRRLGAVRGLGCARYQLLADLDGDGAPELITPDADGVHAVDPGDGQRVYCGDVEPGNNGVLSTRAIDLLPSPGQELVVFGDQRVTVVDLSEGAVGDCAADAGLRAAMVFELDEDTWIDPAGSAVLDVDGDAIPEIVTSVWDARRDTDRTLVLGLDGALRHDLPGARLLDARDVDGDGVGELLVARADPDVVEPFAAVELLSVRGGAPAPLWPAPMGAARLLADWPTATATDASPDLARPAGLRDGFLLLVDEAGPFGAADGLVRRGVGAGVVTPLEGAPGGAQVLVDPRDPARDALALSLADGTLTIFDADLGVRDAMALPTGAARLLTVSAEGPRLVVHDQSGALAAVDLAGAEPEPAWTLRLGSRPARALDAQTTLLRVPHPAGDRVVVRDPSQPDRGAWAVIDALDGRRLQFLGHPGHDFAPIAAAVFDQGDAARVLTFERAADDAPVAPRVCDVWVDALDPDPECPARSVRPTLVTAWRLDGTCAWRARVRPHLACAGPGGQTLSVVGERVFVTESNAVRVFAARTGALEETIDLGRFDPRRDGTRAPRGGGAFEAAGDLLLRVGGNGPIEAYDDDLRLVWTTPQPEGASLQGWVNRRGAVFGDTYWITPGPGLPLHRYALADGRLLGRVWLGDGRAHAVVPAGESAELGTPLRVDDLLLVPADDGRIYGLDPFGRLVDVLELASTPAPPQMGDLDGDGEPELLLALGDGSVMLRGRARLGAPARAWDVHCPPTPDLCETARDVDETVFDDALCALWTAVDGVTAYDTRILGPNGAVVRPWAVRGGETFTDYAGLELVRGARYQVQVRAWRIEDDQVVFSDVETLTDGVTVVDPQPPAITRFEAAPDPVPRGGRTTIVVEATDDDRIAGWSLAVHDRRGRVARLTRGELAHGAFRGEHTWDGTDRVGRRLVGDFTLVARVVDRAGGEAVAQRPIRLCRDDCR